MLTPDQVIPAALAAGMITPADIVEAGVEVHSIGRSHPVARLSVAGVPRLVFKSFGVTRGDTDGTRAREVAVAELGLAIPALGRLLAPQIPFAGDAEVVVSAHVPGQTPWLLDGVGGSEIAGEPLDWAGLVAIVAAPLAAMHRATAGLAREGATVPDCLRTTIPWGLRLFDGDGPADLWQSPPLVPLLRRLAASPAIVAGTRRARAAWRMRCLIHGDLKHDNLLVAREAGAARLTLIDWEMARLGDPAWDLAGLLVRLVLANAAGPAWPEPTVGAAAMLVRAYAAAAAMPAPPLAQRMVLYTGAWLQMTALQYVSLMGGAPPGDQLEPMLTAAATTLAEADAITRAVLAAAR